MDREVLIDSACRTLRRKVVRLSDDSIRAIAEVVVDDVLWHQSQERLEGTFVKARATDPATSHSAADLVRARARSQRVKLLHAFAEAPEGGYTDEEAAQHAGVSLDSEYATRCSELRSMGVLAVTGETRVGRNGVDRMVSAITAQGRTVLVLRQSA